MEQEICVIVIMALRGVFQEKILKKKKGKSQPKDFKWENLNNLSRKSQQFPASRDGLVLSSLWISRRQNIPQPPPIFQYNSA